LTDHHDADGSTLPLPPGFYNSLTALLQRDDEPPPTASTSATTTTNYPVLFDAGCNVAEALDVIAQLKKSKTATSTTTYRQALAQQSALPYGGCLVRHMLKAEKSWNGQGAAIQWIKEADPHLYFVVGLGPTFGVSRKATASDDEDSQTDDEADDVPTSLEDDMEAAVDALTDALEDDESVVGVYGKLDYRPEVLSRGAGYDRAAQLVRFRATCRAARLAGVPIQCRVAPGASETTTTSATAEGEEDAYTSVVRDLAKVLVESSAAHDQDEGDSGDLKIHLVSWNGTCAHMVKLLAAFPETLFVGLNASTGYTKATQLHACAFDVPLDRLLLETDAPQAIPAPVAAQSKTAFCHAGLIPWVAAAVAQHKAPTTTAVAVAAFATQNVVRLYGSAVIGARVEEVAAEFAAACEAARVEQQQQQESEDLLLEGQAEELATIGDPAPAEVFESKQERKKKKKKKGQPKANVDTTAVDADLEFDEEFLASLAVNDD
jgi:Tat protein secretion system quality control protein TatD with DNase activity